MSIFVFSISYNIYFISSCCSLLSADFNELEFLPAEIGNLSNLQELFLRKLNDSVSKHCVWLQMLVSLNHTTLSLTSHYAVHFFLQLLLALHHCQLRLATCQICGSCTWVSWMILFEYCLWVCKFVVWIMLYLIIPFHHSLHYFL